MAAHKMMLKFTNILRRAFFVQKSNKQLFCKCSLGLNVFLRKEVSRKAAHKMLVKLTFRGNFMNVLLTAFAPTVLHH